MRGGKQIYGQSAEKILKNAYRNSSRKRGLALTLTSGMLMVLVIFLAGFLQGKIRADQIRYQREHGSSIYAYVENGTPKTAWILEQIPLIRQVGYEKQYGQLFTNGLGYSDCSVMEEEDWRTLKAVAYTDICGTYPEESNEIMMSVQTLKSFGIQDPQVGMKLCLEFYWKSVFIQEETGPQEFILSGYFTDYTGNTGSDSISYISKKKLEKAGIPEFPCRILLDVTSGLRSGEQTERMLSDSVSLAEDEYFVAEDSAFYKSIRGIAGSFGAGIVLLLLISFSGVLLIFRMIRISFLRDERLFETLRILGVTGKQIRKVVCGQFLRDLMAGTVLGGFLACMIVWLLFPRLNTRMYMGEAGKIDASSFLLVLFYAGAVPVVCLAGWLTAVVSFQTLSRKRGAGNNAVKRKNKRKHEFSRIGWKKQQNLWRKRKSFLLEMAWKSVKNSGQSFLFGVLLVSMGGIAALCAVSLTSGTDLLRRLENQPDFQVGLTYSGYEFLERQKFYAWNEYSSPESSETDFFPENLKECLVKLSQQKAGNVEIKKGYLPSFDTDFSYDGAHNGRISELYKYAPDIPRTMICTLSEEEERRLCEQISSGRKSLEEGEAILLHRGIPFKEPPGGSGQGVTFFAYDVLPSADTFPEWREQAYAAKLKVVESADLLKTDLADLNLIWSEENVCWVMVSEETYRKLSETLQEYVLEINLSFPEEQRTEAEEKIRRYVKETNEAFRNGYGVEADQVFLTCKSETIALETKYLENSRFCMAAVCVVLFLLGILTYGSTRYLDLVMRENEQKMLRILGITQRQQKTVLRLEGMIHCVVLAILLAAAGNGVIVLLDRLVKHQSEHFYAHYPWGVFGILVLTIFGVSLALPEIIKRKRGKP